MLVVAARWTPRRWLVILGVAIGVATALRIGTWLLTSEYDWTFFATPNRADAVLAGCALAFLYSIRPWRPRRAVLLLGLGGIAVGSVIDEFGFLAVAGLPLATFGSAMMVAAATDSVPVLGWRPLRYAGRISYSLYLWHVPVLVAAHAVLNPPIAVVVGVAASIAIAAASRVLVEEPMLRWRRSSSAQLESRTSLVSG